MKFKSESFVDWFFKTYPEKAKLLIPDSTKYKKPLRKSQKRKLKKVKNEIQR